MRFGLVIATNFFRPNTQLQTASRMAGLIHSAFHSAFARVSVRELTDRYNFGAVHGLPCSPIRLDFPSMISRELLY